MTGEVTYLPEEAMSELPPSELDDTPDEIAHDLLAGPVLPGTEATMDVETVVTGTDAYSAVRSDNGDTVGLVTFDESADVGWLIEQIDRCDAP